MPLLRKLVRAFLFLYFGKRGFRRNQFKSIISPIEIETSESKIMEKRVNEFIKIIKPKLIPLSEFVRIGSKFDGGYVVPKIAINHSSYLISGGISNNNEFEIHLAKKGLVGVQVDYSITEPPVQHSNLKFLQKKLGEDITLEEVSNFFPLQKGGILKLDIEGSEYKVLKDFNRFTIYNLITVEFHYLDRLIDSRFYSDFRKSLLRINKSHSLVYLSPNNCCGYSIIGGQPIPRVMEFTWLNQRLFKKIPKSRIRDNYRKLSAPNKPTKASLDISNLFPNW
jgi:hypothetical protein